MWDEREKNKDSDKYAIRVNKTQRARRTIISGTFTFKYVYIDCYEITLGKTPLSILFYFFVFPQKNKNTKNFILIERRNKFFALIC